MAIVPSFRPAKRSQCKAAVVIGGLAGSGKSGLALAMAHALTKDWSKIAAVDTENRSLDLYTGLTLHTGDVADGFSVGDLTAEDGYKPSHYMAFREAAINSGFTALICDSISHMWQYKGGVLDMVNDAKRSNTCKNDYTVWGLPEIAAEKNLIIEMIRHPKLHCINTIRVKEKMEIVTEDGKTKIKSLGEQQIIMPDFKFEPDLVLMMLTPGDDTGRAPVGYVEKSRYSLLKVGETYSFTAELLEQLRMFLEEGTSPEALMEMQRQDYIEAIKAYLDEHPNAKAIWPALKENMHIEEGVKLTELKLSQMKALYSQLAT